MYLLVLYNAILSHSEQHFGDEDDPCAHLILVPGTSFTPITVRAF